ncbi:hypothetical protein SVIO_011980 [Streptomyces violaceusniger]|uniref:Mandelate racemase/muconate lactonizing enzyme N-terminal domain-containing protein n=1 Tax=Streptomyces violaceusniger TaxID=68280 RepID=A0A4D4KNT2_STRVO|nr:hypothetical protein SVIO_011980 [Streptomyces violaceusniger]
MARRKVFFGPADTHEFSLLIVCSHSRAPPMVEGRADRVRAAVEVLTEYLIGQDPTRIEDHWQVMTKGGFYRGGPVLSSAVSGLDQALWDTRASTTAYRCTSCSAARCGTCGRHLRAAAHRGPRRAPRSPARPALPARAGGARRQAAVRAADRRGHVWRNPV